MMALGTMKPNYISENRRRNLTVDCIERFQELGLEMGKIQTILSDPMIGRKFFKGDAHIVVMDLEKGQTVFAAWKS